MYVCGYKTPGFSNLKEHIEVKHENVKPFPCNVCDARFYRKTRMEHHVKGNFQYIFSFACNSAASLKRDF